MKMYLRSLLLLGAIALSQSSTAYSESGIEVNFHGTHMEFPYFEQAISAEMSPELAQELKDIGVAVLEFIDTKFLEIFSDELAQAYDNIRYFRCADIAREMKAVIEKVPKEGVELAKKFGYDKYILDMTDRLMSRAKELEKSKKTGVTSLYMSMRRSIQGTVKAIRASSNSVFVAWGKGKIDSENAEDFAADMMSGLRHHGLADCLDMFAVLLKVLFG